METHHSNVAGRRALSLHKKHGTFEFTAPAILFACLLFSLTAPSYIWGIL